MTLLACSRMYDVAPAARDAWHAVFGRVAALSGLPLTMLDYPAPAPLDALWLRPDLGCAFMCGWPWTMAGPRPVPLAAPVPSPARYGGRAEYVSDLVTRADAPYRTLDDAFGGRMGWTVHHSHSGWNAPRHHLLRRVPGRPLPFAEAVGPLVSAAAVVDAVLDGRCDVGPLDGFVHDLLRRHAPGRVAGLRVLESTDPAPIPLLVASPGTPAAITDSLRAALLRVHEDAAGAAALAEVLVARFVPADPARYDAVAPLWAAEAAAAGVAHPPEP